MSFQIDRNERAGLLLRVLAVVAAAALASALLRAIFLHAFEVFEFLHSVLVMLVYSSCIAIPASLTLDYLGHKCAARGREFFLILAVGVLLAANLSGCLLADLLLVVFGMLPPHQFWIEYGFAIRFGTVITLIFGLGMSFYEWMRGKLEMAAMEEERANKLLAEARLSSLESRIHPHFLFNTLNSISSLIPSDPKRAEDMILKLSSLLRFSLNSNQTKLVPLSQELKVVRDYLEIEKARFGQRLRYTIDVPASMENLGVPPLSIESLVENSVKHVIAQRPEGGEILIVAANGSDGIAIDVRDDGPGFALEPMPSGHGLENLTHRLNLLFGPAGRLDQSRDGPYSTVRISLPAAKV